MKREKLGNIISNFSTVVFLCLVGFGCYSAHQMKTEAEKYTSLLHSLSDKQNSLEIRLQEAIKVKYF